MLAAVRPLGVERVPLGQAAGRALSAPLPAAVDNPPWDNSAMDGFAARAEDLRGASPNHAVVLPVSDEVPAGAFPSGPLKPGTAARVMTGAPVPAGADSVIRVEHTAPAANGCVRIDCADDAFRHVRRQGEDFRTGDVLLGAGEMLGPGEIALLASQGCASVAVGRRPRVGVLANGDELVEPGDFAQVKAGRRIVNTNSWALAAQIREAGGEPVMLGIARDDPADVARKIDQAADLDGMVSAGGVSVGDHDHVKDVLDAAGFERVFWRVKLRPGSATVFGLLGSRPVWGVPGNPASALVTFDLLARPAIRAMAGYSRIHRANVRCTVRSEVRGPASVLSAVRVRFLSPPADSPPDGTGARPAGDRGFPLVEPNAAQGSGMMTSMCADGLLLLPVGCDRVGPGEQADVAPLREWSFPGQQGAPPPGGTARG